MLPILFPIQMAPDVVAFLVAPVTLFKAITMRRTYGAPNDYDELMRPDIPARRGINSLLRDRNR